VNNKSERKEHDRHMRADEKVCQMILILHEHEETGEAISTNKYVREIFAACHVTEDYQRRWAKNK
jgi:hypothetical protein